MAEGDTIELIPINLIEAIIRNDDIFVEFVNSRGTYKDFKKDLYVAAVNDYMDYVFYHSQSLTKDDISRVNYINTAFGTGKRYDYEEYLSKTEQLVNIEMLFAILRNEDIFNKFMDYENNKKFFGDFDIQDFIGLIFDFMDFIVRSSIELTEEEMEKVQKIRKKYSLFKKGNIKLNGYVANADDLDAELFNSILKSIDIGREPFFVARAVYIELAKRVNYDPLFIALNQDVKNDELAKKIYEKSIAEITSENNTVTCRSWAELYASMLNKLGLKAVVSGSTLHKYVTFDCDGTLIKADATESVMTWTDDFTLPDIARIQMGLATGGYTCLEVDKDISELLDKVDEELSYHVNSMEEQFKSLEREYMAIKANEPCQDDKIQNSIFDILEFLKSASENSSLEGLEFIAYMVSLTKVLFEKSERFEKQTKTVCRRCLDGTFEPLMLLVVVEENLYRYFLFTKGQVQEVSGESLLAQMDAGDIVIAGRNKKILGVGDRCGFTK